MASKLLIFLALAVAVQGSVAAPAPGIRDWFSQAGNFFENMYNVQNNVSQQAAENAEKVWQEVVDAGRQESQEVASWVQNGYDQSAAAWNSIQNKLQAATQKTVSSAQQAMVSAGQQVPQEAAQWVQQASSNLQSAVNAISSKTQENFERAEQFVKAGEAALEKLQQQQSAASNQVIQRITKNIQQGLQNVQSLVNKASSEVNKNSS